MCNIAGTTLQRHDGVRSVAKSFKIPRSAPFFCNISVLGTDGEDYVVFFDKRGDCAVQ